jgi:hypothetical protein
MSDVLYRRAICTSGILPVKSFTATCTLDETDKHFSHKLLLYFAFFVKCLDFDILIESFISLCIIETVGEIFREYKPWIVLLITQ